MKPDKPGWQEGALATAASSGLAVTHLPNVSLLVVGALHLPDVEGHEDGALGFALDRGDARPPAPLLLLQLRGTAVAGRDAFLSSFCCDCRVKVAARLHQQRDCAP